MSGTIRTFQFAPQWGPMAGFLRLVQGAVTAPTQGPWLPCGLFQAASVDIEGSSSTITAGVRLANTLAAPLNGYTVTIGGSVTAGDVVSVSVASSLAGSVTVSHTVASGDTIGIIAASLASSLGENEALAAAGFVVNEGSAIVTMTFPSLAAGMNWQDSGAAVDGFATAPPIDCVSVTASVGGAATETATVSLVNNGMSEGSLSTNPGRLELPSLPARWVQGNVTALTGAGANVNLNLAGVA